MTSPGSPHSPGPTTSQPLSDDEVSQEVISGPQSAPLPHDTSQPRRVRSTASRRGWGEAPTYLEAMSSPSPDASFAESGGVPPPRSNSIRNGTTSGFRDLLSRAGLTFAPLTANPRTGGRQEMSQHTRHSSTSLLLQPQSSRFSASSTASGTMGNETSPPNSPWASTHSLHISSPVPNSAVRASFDSARLPRAGLSDEQMRFLSSSEAVNLAGVKMGNVPAGRRRRRSEVTALGESMRIGSDIGSNVEEEVNEGPPPTWEQVDGERRRGEAEARRGLGRPVRRDNEPVEVVEGGDIPRLGEQALQSSGEPVVKSDKTLAQSSIPIAAQSNESSGSTESVFSQQPVSSITTATTPSTTATSPSSSAIPQSKSIPDSLAPSVQIEPPTPISPTSVSIK